VIRTAKAFLEGRPAVLTALQASGIEIPETTTFSSSPRTYGYFALRAKDST